MKVLYAGTGEIGLPTLRWLIDDPGIELVGVVCQPDKPVGRKQVLTPPATKALAIQNGIPVHQPVRLRKDPSCFVDAGADVIVVMAYGQILPKAVLDAPELACLNLHASILPRHRGASPIQAAIREGDAESGVTVMFMDEGLDTGDVLLIHRFPLKPGETGGELHDRLGIGAPAALAEALALLEKGKAPRVAQDNTAATHCGKLTREDGVIEWSRPAAELELLINAYDPWPGTHTRIHSGEGAGKAIKVFPPVTICPTTEQAPPGTILSANEHGFTVQTGREALIVREIQPEGKRRMQVADFMKGNVAPAGFGS